MARKSKRAPADVPAPVPEEIRLEAAGLIAAGAQQAKTTVDPLSHRARLIQAIVPEMLGYGAIAVDTALEQLDGSNRAAALSYLASCPDVVLIDNRIDRIDGWTKKNLQGDRFGCRQKNL